ncbi:MAG: LLM class F420-dependent oxidoreductase [Dehalococcoidia bacterium]|nr:LLM class F420-dependent oxidoreductase [Dehalococcoidia bacterium]
MATAHPVRFGFQIGPQYISWQALKEIFLMADELGYDTGFTFDHFLPISPGGAKGENWVEDTCLEGWTTLTALGALTRRLLVGCLVTGNTYRHPAVLANMAATVDHITNGRLIHGIGAAWYELEHRQYGIPFYTVGERMQRLAESVQIYRLLMTEQRATFAGKHYTITDALCEPKPIQKPWPPILIGGGGEKVLLKIVARYADIWHSFGSVAVFQHKLNVLRAHCQTVGRDFATIEKAMAAPVILADHRADADARLAATPMARRIGVEATREMAFVGNPDDVAARVQQYVDIGVTHILLNGVQNDLASFERFAKEVIPRFR